VPAFWQAARQRSAALKRSPASTIAPPGTGSLSVHAEARQRLRRPLRPGRDQQLVPRRTVFARSQAPPGPLLAERIAVVGGVATELDVPRHAPSAAPARLRQPRQPVLGGALAREGGTVLGSPALARPQPGQRLRLARPNRSPALVLDALTFADHVPLPTRLSRLAARERAPPTAGARSDADDTPIGDQRNAVGRSSANRQGPSVAPATRRRASVRAVSITRVVLVPQGSVTAGGGWLVAAVVARPNWRRQGHVGEEARHTSSDATDGEAARKLLQRREAVVSTCALLLLIVPSESA